MTDLSTFAITDQWPAQHPERLPLYSLPTPNGVKVSIFLEESWLAYEPHLATFPWVGNLVGFYGAGDLVGIAEFP